MLSKLILSLLLIGFLLAGFSIANIINIKQLNDLDKKFKEEINNLRNYTMKEKLTYENKSLKELLEKEVNLVPSNESWNCYDYAEYYNRTLSVKYPELDIRWIRYVDICNNLTLCDSYHTFLVIGGYKQEVLLDQHMIAINDLR